MLMWLLYAAFLANIVTDVFSTDPGCTLPEKCNKPNEHWVNCTVDCLPKNCSQLGLPVPCPRSDLKCPGGPGCICNAGYLRNNKGDCVKKIQCPKCGGDENAESGCGNCPKTCGNYNNTKPQICNKSCDLNGCNCKKGYVLDQNKKKCVLPKNCTPICGPDEYFDTCSNGGCHKGRTCEQSASLNGSTICVDPIRCEGGCLCKEGFVRNSNGICVSKDKCPKPCKDPNAKPGCGQNCGRRCSNYNKGPVACAAICQLNGCDCKPGYVIDDNLKICVLPENCTPVCGPDEYFDTCSNGGCHKGRTCEQSAALNGSTICVDPIRCKGGCLCKEGLVRNSDGICINKDKCPITCGGDPNARPGCGQNCGRRCSNYDKGPVACAAICQVNGCDCKDRFVYDDNKKICVLPENCSPVCSLNEQYTPCFDSNCDDIQNCFQTTCGSANRTVCKYPKKCMAGCICQKGFLRNGNGICVPKNECSLNDQCNGKVNEYWDPCPPMCFTESCAGRGKPVKCLPQAAVCRPRCRCAPGFYRDNKGVCISQNQCPKNPCNKTNELYDECPPKCPPGVCGIDDRLIDCAPQPLPGDPDCLPPACLCAGGFYRDDKGECVKWEKCPKCPIHEVFDPCPPPCPPQICSVDERVIRCAAPPKIGDPECRPGCRCEEGYKRDSQGLCIPKDKCPPICRGANEIYDPCPNARDPNTCDSIGKKYPLQITDGKSCKGACRCKTGFYRNILGDCVPKEDCLKCTGPNEYYSCGSACDNVCATLSQQNQTNCPIVNVRCNDMCYCIKGFARNRQGICVPISTCHNCKGPREYNDPCPPTCPPNDSCDTYKKVYSCPAQIANDTSHCKPACRCEDNFLRDKTGTCIPQEQCPCNGDPNAKPGCGCSQTCSDYCANRPPRCTKICKINACNCKDGYVLEEKSGQCISPTDCPGYQNPVTTPAPAQQNGTTSQNDAVQALSRGVNIFAFDFLKVVLKVLGGENVIVSPLSCQIALAELAMNGENNTEKQLLAALSLSSKDQIRQGFKPFLDSTKSGDGATFTKAVNVYANDMYPLKETFINDTRDIFNGTADEIDCNDPSGSADLINKMVESQTNNRIQNLIPADTISPLTRLIMVNALYFQANWKEQFNKNKTKPGDFHTSDNKTVQVDMMHIETKLEYAFIDNLNAQALRIPYKNSNFSFMIFLPKSIDGLAQTVASLNADTMKTALDSLYLTKVQLSLPSMELNTSLDLVDILKTLGITDIFDASEAALEGMVESREKMFVSAFLQKAFVKVNEEGSEAAAATGVVVTTLSLPISQPPVIQVRADHPFVFSILGNGNILFLGAFNGKL